MPRRVVRRRKRRRPIVRRRNAQAFIEVYYRHLEEVRKNSYHQRVPGWTREDVEAEMCFCIWLAFKQYSTSETRDFGVFWWTIWQRHRVDQIRRFNAEKRAAAELPFDHDMLMALNPVAFPSMQHVDLPDCIEEGEAQDVWCLLAMGYRPTEVKDHLHMSNRRYYALIESWQTPEIHDWLLNQPRDGASHHSSHLHWLQGNGVRL